jgi:uncharacterized RDD family membrane protein YckC
MTTDLRPERAGIWTRAFALLVDGSLVAALLQVLAMALYTPTNGSFHSSVGTSGAPHCATLSKPPEGFDIPADFRVDFVRDCVSSLFGIPFERSVTVGNETQKGAVNWTETLSQDLDASGRPTESFDLSWFGVPLFFAYRVAVEARGRRTIGRILAGVRVVTTSGSKPELRPLLLRYAWFFAPFALVLPLELGWDITPTALSRSIGSEAWTDALVGLLALLPYLWAAAAILFRRDAYYDRFARTRVARIRG